LRGDEGGCNKTLIFLTNIFIEKSTNTPHAPLKGGIEKVDIPNAVTLPHAHPLLDRHGFH